MNIANRIDNVRRVINALRSDGWYNTLTGIGDPLRDKAASGSFANVPALTDQECVDLFRADDIAAKVVAKLPAEALRAGWDLKHPQADAILSAWRAYRGPRDVGLDGLIKEAWTWGRLFGQSAIYPVTADIESSDKPLDLRTVKRVTSFHIIDKRYLSPDGSVCDDPTSPNFGMPERWRWNPINTGRSFIIHHSRLIFFHGAVVPQPEFANGSAGAMRAYCDDSVLLAPYETLRSAGMAWGAVANTIADAGQAVFKMGGLFELIMRKQGEELQNRMTVFDMTRSVARMIVLDKDSEDFDRKQYSFSGYEGIMVRFMERLAAAADMPLTVLFGVSPSGLNATGESDIRLFYDRVAAVRLEILKPKLERLLAIVAIAAGIDPTGIEVAFPPLWQPGPVEAEAIRKSEIERLGAGIESGLYSPEAAREYLSGKEGHPEQVQPEALTNFQAIEAFLASPG